MFTCGALHVSPVGLPVTEQTKLTWPVKPPDGVTVSVEVWLEGGATVMFPLLATERLWLEVAAPLTIACRPSV